MSSTTQKASRLREKNEAAEKKSQEKIEAKATTQRKKLAEYADQHTETMLAAAALGKFDDVMAEMGRGARANATIEAEGPNKGKNALQLITEVAMRKSDEAEVSLINRAGDKLGLQTTTKSREETLKKYKEAATWLFYGGDSQGSTLTKDDLITAQETIQTAIGTERTDLEAMKKELEKAYLEAMKKELEKAYEEGLTRKPVDHHELRENRLPSSGTTQAINTLLAADPVKTSAEEGKALATLVQKLKPNPVPSEMYTKDNIDGKFTINLKTLQEFKTTEHPKGFTGNMFLPRNDDTGIQDVLVMKEGVVVGIRVFDPQDKCAISGKTLDALQNQVLSITPNKLIAPDQLPNPAPALAPAPAPAPALAPASAPAPASATNVAAGLRATLTIWPNEASQVSATFPNTNAKNTSLVRANSI